ncbi:MAG TPA: hypothetical protein VFX12_06370 [Vicinamibacterales bacterium]|nr:hypothetical protein [Vicinamibacterales bacterium]
MKRSIFVASLVAWCLVMSERSAFAYMDPGSGSMLLQILLGGAAGVAVILKLYWQRLLSLFGVRPKDEPPSEHGNF